MKKNGFTLIEVLITLVIIGVLASMSIITYIKYVASNELRQASMKLYMELKNAHQIARQYDCKVFVKFYAAQCSVYVDTNNSGAIDASDKVIKVIKFPSSISIATTPTGPTTPPSDLQTITGMTGNWGTQMIVKPDGIGTTNSGAIYLQSTRLNKTVYCVGIAASMLAIKQYKWGGTSWFNL